MALDDGIQSARLASHLRKKHEKKTKYATMRRRSIAYSIDSLLVGLLSSGVGGIFNVMMPPPETKTEWLSKAAELQFDPAGNIIVPTQAELMSKTMSLGMDSLSTSLQYNWPLLLLNTILIPLLYFSYFIASSHKATPGMRWCKIIVTDQYGAGLSFLHAMGRTLGTFLTTLTLGVGFFTMHWHPRKRALHDVLAQTDVRNVMQTARLKQEIQQEAKKAPVQKMLSPEEMAVRRAQLRAQEAKASQRPQQQPPQQQKNSPNPIKSVPAKPVSLKNPPLKNPPQKGDV